MARRQDLLIGVIIATGFLLFVFLMIYGIRLIRGDAGITSGGPRVAVVELTGPIVDSRSIVRQFKKYGRDDDIDAIVFRIESPGGGVAPSQEIYEEVKRVRESGKVVVASMGSVAASGGYYVSLGAGKIVANPGTLTGSIGVIIGLMNYSELMEKLGLGMEAITSGPYKDSGSPYRKITPTEKEYFQGLVGDIYEQFVGAVAGERGIELERTKQIADGRVFSGSRAFDLGLVDTLGTYEDAIRLAVEMAGLEGTPRIVKERRRSPSVFDLFFGDTRTTLQSLVPVPIPEYRFDL